MLKQIVTVAVALILTASAALNIVGCGKDTGWSKVSEDNPEIVAAREEARANYDEFRKLVGARRPGAIYTAEILYEEGGKSEYLTLDVLSAGESEITGVIIGYPREVNKLNGDEVTGSVENLSDWFVQMPEGDSKGGYVSDVRARLQRAGTGG